MDHSLPGSSVHGFFQARVLEWGASAFSKDNEEIHAFPCLLQFTIVKIWKPPVKRLMDKGVVRYICREQGIKKVEKCLQMRLSTRAEHSCKRDVLPSIGK